MTSDTFDPIKQIIVIRRDLKMRQGKAVAQGAHASGMFLIEEIVNGRSLTCLETEWLKHGMTKITVRVDSEAELLSIDRQAKNAGIKSNLILDSGRTEFHGQPTYTALAIGPDVASKIDPITETLRLL